MAAAPSEMAGIAKGCTFCILVGERVGEGGRGDMGGVRFGMRGGLVLSLSDLTQELQICLLT
jgi:hypothetical protein